ncbi:peptidyl-prolyl cis-trans isomerase [Lenzites betulinus]|nr:peptidyl-prolyl cis-trans isomerase [Lenzites betulinus]
MGVTVHVLTPGDKKHFPRKGDAVSVHYTGTLANGKVFDSSHARVAPFVFNLGIGEVIKGWDQGIPLMSLGEKATLTVSPDLAYGSKGVPPTIPPNATLTFQIELLKIN